MKKYIYCTLIAFMTLGFTSCLNDEPPFKDNGDYGIVELDLSGQRATTAPYANRSFKVDSSTKSLEIEAIVNYTGVNGTSEDVTVQVEVDNGIVTTYSKYSAVTALPAGSYELPSSGSLVIPKGTKTAVYKIRVNTSVLPAEKKTYGIGVKIVSASAGRVSGNFGSGIYLINAN